MSERVSAEVQLIRDVEMADRAKAARTIIEFLRSCEGRGYFLVFREDSPEAIGYRPAALPTLIREHLGLSDGGAR
jgi:hypothetical protein